MLKWKILVFGVLIFLILSNGVNAARAEFQTNIYEDNNGVPGKLVNPNDYNRAHDNVTLEVGKTYFIEITARDLDGRKSGFRAVSLDVAWDPKILKVEINCNYNIDESAAYMKYMVHNLNPLCIWTTSNLPLFHNGQLDNEKGTIHNFGGAAFLSSDVGRAIGNLNPERFCLLKFKAEKVGEIPFRVRQGGSRIVTVPVATLSDSQIYFEPQIIKVIEANPCSPACSSGQTCSNGQCVCTPQCLGKQCGEDDGCGNKCSVQTCNDNNLCTIDSCSFPGSCSYTPITCPAGQTCLNGECINPNPCTPQCTGKQCGADDSCGNKCIIQTCETGQACSPVGVCTRINYTYCEDEKDCIINREKCEEGLLYKCGNFDSDNCLEWASYKSGCEPSTNNLQFQVNFYRDNNGKPGTLLNNNEIMPGQTIYADILMKDGGGAGRNPAGIIAIPIDISWNPKTLENIDSVPIFPNKISDKDNYSCNFLTCNFPLQRFVDSIDNSAGLIHGLRGASIPNAGTLGKEIGKSDFERFSLLKFKVKPDASLNSRFFVNLAGSMSFADAGMLTGVDESNSELKIVGSKKPSQNQVNPLDVNNDSYITPLDVLVVINTLNSDGPRELTPLGEAESVLSSAPYYDTNGDNMVSPLDALIIINYINERV